MSVRRIAPKQRGPPFPKGHSGNPRGRPPGARNAATVLAEQLLDGEAYNPLKIKNPTEL